jgi:hypothetical protein
VQTVREDLQHLMDAYGSSPALLRIRGLPVYYVYDSYRIPADAWAKLLAPTGDSSVRGTRLDGGSCDVTAAARGVCRPFPAALVAGRLRPCIMLCWQALVQGSMLASSCFQVTHKHRCAVPSLPWHRHRWPPFLLLLPPQVCSLR